MASPNDTNLLDNEAALDEADLGEMVGGAALPAGFKDTGIWGADPAHISPGPAQPHIDPKESHTIPLVPGSLVQPG